MEKIRNKPKQGLLIVYTGNGKGKTTAALGMCVRAVGYALFNSSKGAGNTASLMG